MRIVCQECLLPGSTTRDRFAACKAYGFNGIEPAGADVRKDPVLYRELAREFDLPVTSFCLGWEGCLLDPNPQERQKAVEGIVALMRIGDTFGGVGLVMPPIFGPPRLPDLLPFASAITLEKQLLVLLLKEIAGRVRGLRSVLLIEPLNRYEQHLLRTVADAIEIADQIGSPNIGVLADLFHMSLEEPGVEASLRRYAGKYRHVHLADSNRMLPGQGRLDFPRYLRALIETGYDGVLALECNTTGSRNLELPRAQQYITRLIHELRHPETEKLQA